MAHQTGAYETLSAADPVLTAVRMTSVLTIATLVFQFVTAGDMIGGAGNELVTSLHAAGAIGLHVMSGLAMLATVALWRTRGAALWPAVVSAVVFVVTFAAATAGSSGQMVVHVPLAIVMTIGAVVVATWAFVRAGAAG